MAKNTKATTVTIANGGTATPTITMDPSKIPLALEMPAAFTGTAITFTATHLEPTDQDDVEVVFPSSAPSSWGAPSPALAALMLEAVR